MLLVKLLAPFADLIQQASNPLLAAKKDQNVRKTYYAWHA
jgi:hypothetical protein